MYDIHLSQDQKSFSEACVSQAIIGGAVLPKGHGRLIDADALMKYCQNNKSKMIDCNDIARFPTIVLPKIWEDEE